MKNYKRILTAILFIIFIIILPVSVSAHSGRTDSQGGHHDYKNQSGLGSYHYHCGGHPAHLHKNGICPYAPSDTITFKSYPSSMNVGDSKTFDYEVSSAKSNVKTTITSSNPNVVSVTGRNLKAINAGTAVITVETSTVQRTFSITVSEVYADSLDISVKSDQLQVEDSMQIGHTMTPNNITDKTLNFSSSDDSIATVNSNGKITGISSGDVTITVTTSNNISKSVDLTIFEVVPESIECVESIDLIVGDTYSVDINVLPENSNNKEYEITSDDEDIITCSSTELTALKEGITIIHIKTWNGISSDIQVNVGIIPVEKITIVDSTNYLIFNILNSSQNINVSTKAIPENSTCQEVQWSSSNENIISVADNEFNVNGIGFVTLTCTSHENNTDSINLIIINQDIIVIFFIVIVLCSATIIFVVYKKKHKVSKNNDIR